MTAPGPPTGITAALWVPWTAAARFYLPASGRCETAHYDSAGQVVARCRASQRWRIWMPGPWRSPVVVAVCDSCAEAFPWVFPSPGGFVERVFVGDEAVRPE